MAGNMAPPGTVAVMRSPIEAFGACTAPATNFCTISSTASACPGDSGSGFVTMVNGRATVDGIVIAVNDDGSCNTANHQVEVTGVFSNIGWITSTIGRTVDKIDGHYRLRWSGSSSNGTLRIECYNSIFGTYNSVIGPMNVPGVQVSTKCDDFPPGGEIRTKCTISDSPLVRVFRSFTRRVKNSSGTVLSTQALSYLNSVASFSELAFSQTDNIEYTCGVGSPPSAP